MLRIISVFPTKTYKLVLEFSDKEYRLYDARKHFVYKKSPLVDIVENEELFLTAKVIEDAGTVEWSNGFDLDPDMLYEKSEPLVQLNDRFEILDDESTIKRDHSISPVNNDLFTKVSPQAKFKRENAKSLLNRVEVKNPYEGSEKANQLDLAERFTQFIDRNQKAIRKHIETNTIQYKLKHNQYSGTDDISKATHWRAIKDHLHLDDDTIVTIGTLYSTYLDKYQEEYFIIDDIGNFSMVYLNHKGEFLIMKK